MARLSLAAIAIAALLIARTAEADAIDLDYVAPEGCPTAEAFRREVDARTVASAGADTRKFRVRVEATSRGFAARLEIEGDVREARAPTCAAVVKSIAVFIALARDPQNRVEPPKAEEPPVAPPKAEEPPVAPPKAEKPRAEPVALDRSLPPPTPPRTKAPQSWQIGAGLRAAYLTAPGSAWGARVHAEIAAPRRHVTPLVRVSWGWSDFATTPLRAGEASFRFRTARAEGCAAIDLSTLVLLPCVMAELGDLTATTADLPLTGRASMTWAALGLVGRVRVPLAEWLAVEADVVTLAPLTRKTFALADPVRGVYRVPAVLLEAGVGVSVHARFGGL